MRRRVFGRLASRPDGISGRACRGITLIEAIMTTLLVAVVLGFVANLCNEYAKILRTSSKKDRTLVNAQMAVERVRSEAAQAVKVITPTPGNSPPSSVLKFQKTGSCNPGRLPSPPTPPSPPPYTSRWNPYRDDDQVTLKYYVSGNNLVRESALGVIIRRETLAEDIYGFSVSQLTDPPNTLEIRASFAEENLTKTLTTRIHLRSEQEP